MNRWTSVSSPLTHWNERMARLRVKTPSPSHGMTPVQPHARRSAALRRPDVTAVAVGRHRDDDAALERQAQDPRIEYPVHQRPIAQSSTPGTARPLEAFRKQSCLAPASRAHASALESGRLRRASSPSPLTTPAPRASTTGSLWPPSWPAPLERKGVAVVTCPLRPGPEPGWP